MSSQLPSPALDAACVQALAVAQGHAWVDEAAARRIATGASAAVAAVVATLAATDWDPHAADPDGFAALLESLADPR
jgi:hypothetical protein